MKLHRLFKKDISLVIVSSLLFTIGWPTYGFPFFLFFAFVPLLWLEESYFNNPEKKYFFVKVYLAFFIWNLLKTWWIYYATEVGGIFAVIVNSFLMTTVFWLFHFVHKRTPDSIAYAFFISIWISFEKFHLNWDFSWPWLNLGNGFSEFTKWIQWYEFTGVFGGTFWILIVNLLTYRLLQSFIKQKKKAVLIKESIRVFLWIAVPIVFSLYIYHHYNEKGNNAKVLILQPNLDPWKEKFKYNNAELAGNLLDISKSDVDVIVAPETAISQYVEIDNFEKSSAYRILKEYVDNNNTSFVTGVDFIHWYKKNDSIPATANSTKNGHWYDMYNSAVLIDKTSKYKVYHKSKLVVGAEFTPYAKFLKPIIGDYMINLGTSMGSNVTQNERAVFKITNSDIKLAPIICYESIYGQFVTDYVKNGANLLAVITNDGWWKNTEGHRQHFSMARLRAIENRRDLVHSANTGISGYIDQKGEIIKKMEYDRRGAIQADVYLNENTTFYTKYGDYFASISVFMSALLFLYAFAKKKVRL